MAKQLSTWEQEIARRTGESVRRHRELRNISRETVAGWLDQTTDAVAKAERGERRFSVADLARLAVEFSTSLETLVYGDGPRPTIMRVVKFDGAKLSSRTRKP